MSKPIVILGAGGLAREVQYIFDALRETGEDIRLLGFIVDAEYGQPGTIVNDLPILGDLSWLAANAEKVQAICGVGESHLRYQFVKRAEETGVAFTNAIHPNCTFSRYVTFGKGVVLAAGCNLTSQIALADHVHLNLATTIGHDVVMEPFSTTAPGAHISGNVTMQTGAYLGTGAAVIPKKTVGAWSIVGAGAVVTKDLPANVTAVGAPAKVIKTRAAGWHALR